MANVVEAGGLEYFAAVLHRMQYRIANSTDSKRSDPSREACRWHGWRSAYEKLREMACRLALLELERRGKLVLPARRSTVRERVSARVQAGEREKDFRCGAGRAGHHLVQL